MTTVLVTGVGGGGNGEQLVKCLRMSAHAYRVIGSDLSEAAARQSGADECAVLPPASAGDYIDQLLALCRRYDVDVVLPGSEPELRRMSGDLTRLREHVKLVAVNDPDVIDTCSDKFKTIEFLRRMDIPHPQTLLLQGDWRSQRESLRFPVILKPTTGGGSQNVYIAQDGEELDLLSRYLLRYSGSLLAQEYVGTVDQEFTVGVLLDANGELLQSIALRRSILSSLSNRIRMPNRTGRAELGPVLAVSSGISQGRVDDFPHVTAFCESVALALGARFAINIQCRVVDDQPYIFEINPRFSGTSSIRAMLGFNEPDLLIRKHVLGEQVAPRFPYRHATVLRGLREVLADQGG